MLARADSKVRSPLQSGAGEWLVRQGDRRSKWKPPGQGGDGKLHHSMFLDCRGALDESDMFLVPTFLSVQLCWLRLTVRRAKGGYK